MGGESERGERGETCSTVPLLVKFSDPLAAIGEGQRLEPRSSYMVICALYQVSYHLAPATVSSCQSLCAPPPLHCRSLSINRSRMHRSRQKLRPHKSLVGREQSPDPIFQGLSGLEEDDFSVPGME